MLADTFALQFFCLMVQDEGPTGSQFGGKRFGCECDGVPLHVDGGTVAIVQQIAHAQLIGLGRVQCKRGEAVAHSYGFVRHPGRLRCCLIHGAGGEQSFDERLGGAIEAGRFRAVEFDQAIVDA